MAFTTNSLHVDGSLSLDASLFVNINGVVLSSAGVLVGASSLVTSYGGTGVTSYSQGDLLYYNSGTTLTRLAKTTTTASFLRNGGTNNNPSWSKVNDVDISLGDTTTNNATSSRHGFLPKLNNNNATYLDGQGNWSSPQTLQFASYANNAWDFLAMPGYGYGLIIGNELDEGDTPDEQLMLYRSTGPSGLMVCSGTLQDRWSIGTGCTNNGMTARSMYFWMPDGMTSGHAIEFTQSSEIISTKSRLRAQGLYVSQVKGQSEYDGKVMYFTPDTSSRGYVPSTRILFQDIDVSLSPGLQLQKCFANSHGIDYLVVNSSTAYEFEFNIKVKQSTASYFGFYGTYTNLRSTKYYGSSSYITNDPVADGQVNQTNYILMGSKTNLADVSTYARLAGYTALSWIYASIKGIIYINQGGILYPSLKFGSSVASNAPTIYGEGFTYFKLTPLGNADLKHVL